MDNVELDPEKERILNRGLRTRKVNTKDRESVEAVETNLHGDRANKYQVEEWCVENLDKQEEENNINITGGHVVNNLGDMDIYMYNPVYSDDSDSDNASIPEEGSTAEQTEEIPIQLSIPVRESNVEVKTIAREYIDESHADVLELVAAGYDLKQSVEAMNMFRDQEKAMKYLDMQEAVEDEGDGENVFTRSISRDENEDFDDHGESVVEIYDEKKSKGNLDLESLGQVLDLLSQKLLAAVVHKRNFNTTLLKEGQPNLLVSSPDDVLSCVLTLYYDDAELSLPSREEVLVCNSKTTVEEVSLLWRRAIGDPGFKRVFCLAHAELLSYKVCDAALSSLNRLSQGREDYRLVIICSKENEEKSHIISRLHTYKKPVIPPFVEDTCREYLNKHFKRSSARANAASIADPSSYCVRIVSSTRSGMGKSLYVKNRAELLGQDCLVTIPLHGPVVTADTVLDFFMRHTRRDPCTIYHLDISPKVLREVDCILFSLLILNGLSDRRGNVWKCHPSHLYMVEVTIPESKHGEKEFQTLNLLSLLPTSHCISPKGSLQPKLAPGMLGMDETVFRSSTSQRVYQYLRRHAGTGAKRLDSFTYQGRCEGNVADFLKIILGKCGISDPSWSEVQNFTKFLDIQLSACENSVFCDEYLVGDVMSGLKGFVVKFMIRMSQDFSTPSLECVVARENNEEVQVPQADQANDTLEQYQIVERRRWEQNSHPYIFFNDDRVSITFVGFMVTQNGDLMDPASNAIMEPSIMVPQLYVGLKQNKVNFDEDYRKWPKHIMIEKVATVMGLDFPHDPDETYVLTTDNLVKMLAIQMRFRCDIPVVIMGETGCGKTRLIRYMCDLARCGEVDIKNMLIMKVHGGISDANVISFIEDAEKQALENAKINPRLDTVVFFDEANTTDSIGLIKEIMCDRRINGRPVSKKLKFIAACNPYRKHSSEMVKKLENAGLGFYVRDTETQQKLGEIPLRQLVYRVLDLPPSMRPLVYDFGQLNPGTEHEYTSQIVKDHVDRHEQLTAKDPGLISAIADVLAASQQFMREQKNECSFVSLRDVERAMIVFEYFYEKMDTFAELMDEQAELEYNERYAVPENDDDLDDEVQLPERPVPLSNLTRALILSLSVCYHARLQNRQDYEAYIVQFFRNPLEIHGGAQQFRDEIKWCQDGLLGEMKLGRNIAKNAALRENVFMMAVCIELRIPLFLVGKPGSSKSLAKSIIQDSMLGQGSESDILKEFKHVHIFSYQCSQLSTPESVIEVFRSAEKFQAKQDTRQYVSVVVLDEVGLAEDSPSLPLKALHPLLEDGTVGSGKDHQQRIIEREKRVAFIGISNWALDPAKMNRGVMVTRGEPGLEELKLSAKGICSNKSKDPIRLQLERYFDSLSSAYMEICKQQKNKHEFFGLRDYYSLIKMLYWMCKNSKGRLSGKQLEHAIKRNFGGLENDDVNPMEVFQRNIGDLDLITSIPTQDEELDKTLNPDCTELGLIKTSLDTKDTTWHGENRYLLFLTENYAALDILKHYLKVGSSVESDDEELTSQPFILFGSSFPKDKEYTQVCRNINQIKICMETGRTVILLNLENLYESLYDVLNQYYMYFCGVRYVDLGLQTHRVKCRVHENFKLILIAEKETVYKKFPTPLINRLEKHFVLTSSVLENWQKVLLVEFEEWIKCFSATKNNFEEAHTFIGYQKDTPAAVVFQATNSLRKLQQSDPMFRRLLDAGIISTPLDNSLQEDGSPAIEWTQSVLKLSQFLLIQTAPDDALIRLKNSNFTPEKVEYFTELYFEHQSHSSIGEFLHNEFNHDSDMFIQVTTHSALMSVKELKSLSKLIKMDFAYFNLHEFDSEMEFSNRIGPKFLRDDSSCTPFLLVIQCDSGHLNSDLISCARYRVCDEAITARKKRGASDGNKTITHVLFVIRLPQQEIKSPFVGFQGDPWLCAHIDDLRPSSDTTIIPKQALTASISELFIGKLHIKVAKPLHQAESPIAYDEKESGMVEQSSEENHLPTLGDDLEVFDDMQPITTEDDEESVIDLSDSFMILDPSADKAIEEMDTDVDRSTSVEPFKSVPEDPTLGMSQSGEGIITQLEEATMETEDSIPTGAHMLDVATINVPIPLETGIPPVDPCPESPVVTETTARPSAVVLCPQHRRLRGCIQNAVSRLEDEKINRSMERINKLIKLIPRDPPEHPDNHSFYGLLVTYIHRALEERERERVDEKEWVLNEAMNRRKLQNGGTFRNVLARRIDEAVTPYFAQLIAYIDHNCNMDLIDAKNQKDPLSQLWLQLLTVAVTEISSISLSSGKTVIRTDFRCKFPFSWFVRGFIDSQQLNAPQGASPDLGSSVNIVMDALSLTELGNVLNTVDENSIEEFYHMYLYDFVHYVYKSNHRNELRNMEYTLIMDALDVMTHDNALSPIDGNFSLSKKIVTLHLAYSSCRSEIQQFGQLIQLNPAIVHSLHKTDKDLRSGQNFGLHLFAVQKILETAQGAEDSTNESLSGLDPPLFGEVAEVFSDLKRWLYHVRLSQNIIEAILNSKFDTEETYTLAVKLRLTWQKIRVLQIFAEKVLLPHYRVEGIIFTIRRLEIYLKKNSDFLTKEALAAVKQHLNAIMISGKMIKGCSAAVQKAIRSSCNQFFMEVVSSLCFGGLEAPEPALITMLLDTVMQENETRKFSPYVDSDKSPTIRSFLLQLILEHEPEQVKGYLKDYFDRSRGLVEKHNLDHGLFLLCIQCFEDALSKKMLKFSSFGTFQAISSLLEESYRSLVQHSETSTISLQYLESVAKMRLGLSMVAELLKNGQIDHRVMGITCDICCDTRINVIDPTGRVDTAGPVVYLIKILVRRYGFPVLRQVSQDHHWVIPEQLRKEDTERKSMDLFTIYGEGYRGIRDAFNTVIYTKKNDDLDDTVGQTNEEKVFIALSLFEKATLSRGSLNPAKQINEEAVQLLSTFIQAVPAASPDVLNMMRLLLVNQQGGPLAQMTISPQQLELDRTLTGLVVHTAAVVLNSETVDILLPFVNILRHPTLIENAYLPTMPQDVLQDIKHLLHEEKQAHGTGRFYECPNGHPYFVGNCGNPVMEFTCLECHARVGGRNTLLADNKQANQQDTTKTGHALGDPKQRSTYPEQLRELSTTAVCIMRAIMHCAFIWASCTNDRDIVDIAKVTKAQVLPHELPEFFWLHLEKDMECLSRCTGRGIDDCAIIVHLVLKEMLCTTPHVVNVDNVKHLQSKDQRKEWERLFATNYIDPLVKRIDASINQAMDIITNDDQEAHDELFFLAYERVKVDESKLSAHLWTYRQQINLEHLKRSLQSASTVKVKILNEFLQMEPTLRATKYLPDIFKLQKFMKEYFDRRLEKSKAEVMTIGEFLRSIQGSRNENTGNECRKMVESVKNAWILVGEKLKNHRRLPVEEKHFIPRISDQTPLVYLIPTTTEEGRCTTALVDYLVIAHNKFIEECRNIVSQGQGSASAVWKEHKVPITHLHQCHLMDYEQHLQSIILSHCHYSLTVGKGQDIKYDLPALERHILNRFIYGKPTILIDIPCVAYRRDIYTIKVFSDIRKKVEQVPLHQRLQQDIITELQTPERLRESLDVVDIVLGLLSSGGGDPLVPLRKYISSRRMNRKPFSTQAKEHCTLGHVISLWETISVELARQLWHNGQEPFEGIPDNYSRALSPDQGTQLDRCLRKFDLDQLLGILFEYIEVAVKHIPSHERHEDWELVEAVDTYWANTGQILRSEQFMEDFPKSLTVDQAVATWKHVADYKSNQH